MKIRDNDIDFPLGILSPRFKDLRDLLQHDALLLSLSRNGFQLSIFEKCIDDFSAILRISLFLQICFVALLLNDLQNTCHEHISAKGIHHIILALVGRNRTCILQLFQMEGNRRRINQKAAAAVPE